MSFDNEFLLQILIYALSFGTFYGTTTTRLKNLEQKMDKHNSFIERIYSLEDKVKSANAKLNKMFNDTYNYKKE